MPLQITLSQISLWVKYHLVLVRQKFVSELLIIDQKVFLNLFKLGENRSKKEKYAYCVSPVQQYFRSLHEVLKRQQPK